MKSTLPTPHMCVLLAEAYPQNTAKLAARAAGVSHRTAEAWTTGRRSPAADILLRMATRCDAMAAALERYLDALSRSEAPRSHVEGDSSDVSPHG